MKDKPRNKSVGIITALDKLQKYCAYQDRCHKEVRNKLYELGIYGEDQGQIIVELIAENFLNEERFARSYARGKFRMKKWGKMKIIQGLKQRQVSEYCIKKGLKEIDDEEYEEKLQKLLERKNELLREKNIYVKRKKLFNYAYQKGYESFLIQSIVKNLTSGN
jgi:regulatory protein